MIAFLVMLAVAAPVAASPASRAAAAARVEAARADPGALEALVADTAAPAAARARALLALGRGAGRSLSPRTRLFVKEALGDRAAPVRRAAVRLVREAGDRALEREVLKRVAEDPDPGVRAEALDAVERWTRPTHLYFLEAALASEHPEVRARAVRNLGRLARRDLRPDLVEAVRRTLERGTPAERASALRALAAWGELGDEDLAAVIAAPDEAEFVLLEALEAARGRAGPALADAVADALARAPSLRAAWACYAWLRENAPGRDPETPVLARILDGEVRTNRALEEFARHLQAAGYRVEHGKAGWRVLRRP
ncbi:hypothetical protein JCM30394_30800 [Deferrisoma palaeochoriense]